MSQQPQGNLTLEDEEHLRRILPQINTSYMPPWLFRLFWHFLPMVPFELAVLRYIDGVPHVLMFHRQDQDYTGWHMPGGYTWQTECSNEETATRVLRREVGLVPADVFFVRNFNSGPESGWVPNRQHAKLCVCEAYGEPTAGKFFPLDALPQDTLGHHVMMVEHLRAYLIRMETMRTKGIRYDGTNKAQKGKWLLVEPLSISEDMAERSRGNMPFPYTYSFNTLDEAVNAFVEKHDGACCVVDDEGRQII